MTMTKKDFHNRVGIVLTSIGLFVLALGLYSFVTSKNSHTTPLTSYQAKNLESLKIVRPNDLVICTVERPGTLQTEIKFAFLVEQNKGEYMTGYYPSQYTLSRADGGESFSLLSEWKCEMRILRPSETRAATDMLASIILYGLNPR